VKPRFAELATQQSQMNDGAVRATQPRAWDPTQTQSSQDNNTSLWSSRSQNESLLLSGVTQSNISRTGTQRRRESLGKKSKILPPVPRFRKYNRDSRNASRQGSIFARRRETQRRQKAARQRRLQMERKASVQIVRTYRSGELPDIQIKWRDVIDPLRVLCGLDGDVAAITIESVFRYLYMMGDHENELEESVVLMLSQTNGNPTVMSLLGRLCDITQTTGTIDTAIVESKAADSVSFHDSVFMLEGLLLRSSNSNSATISALVTLYSKLQMNDIVMSLVSSHASNQTTRDAVMMEQKCDVRLAYKTYRDLADKEDNEIEIEFEDSVEKTWWEDGRMRCMELLQLWSTVYDNSIVDFDVQCDENDLDRNASLVTYMSDPSQRRNATRFVKSSLRISDASRENLVAFCAVADSNWLSRNHAAAVATVYALSGDQKRAISVVSTFYEEFLTRWSQLHPLAIEARNSELRKLQAVAEVSEFLNLSSPITWQSVDRALKTWENRFPSVNYDSPSIWEEVTTTRIMLFQHLELKLRTSHATTDEIRCADRLLNAQAEALLKAADGMTTQGYLDIAKKYMKRAGSDFAASSLRVLEPFVKLNTSLASRHERLGEIKEQLEKLRGCVRAIESKYAGDDDDDVTIPMSLVLLRARANVALSRAETNVEARRRCQTIARKSFEEYISKESELDKRANGSLALANFCDEILRKFEEDEEHEDTDLESIAIVVVKCVLRACSHHGYRAGRFIPRLFELIGTYGERIGDVFRENSHSVPTWIFVRWCSQLMALLPRQDREGSHALYILERIATEYPQSLYFSYRISAEDISDRSCLGRLPGLLKDPLLEKFVESLEALHNPHLWWNFYESPPIVRLKRVLASGNRGEALRILKDLESRTLCERTAQGRFLKRWAKVANLKMRRPFDKLRDAIESSSCSRQSMEKLLKALCKTAGNYGPRGSNQDLAKLGKDMGKCGYLRDRSAPVEWWSQWLSDFDGPSCDTKIEIPAQYDGKCKPNLESHATVETFGRDLKVMCSKQLPKRLLVRGSDRKDRLYLVKGGEDLRLDSRIEELFEVMNEIMSRDPSCSRRNLSIKTYVFFLLMLEFKTISFRFPLSLSHPFSLSLPHTHTHTHQLIKLFKQVQSYSHDVKCGFD